MSGPSLRVGVVGGVPASLARGGLELQIERTSEALRRRGHEVRVLAREPDPWDFDVLHAFSSGPDVAHWLTHWRRNTAAPLVLSPVMVVPPGRREWRQRVAHRLPVPEFGPWQRTLLLRRATALVALTKHEAQLLRRLGGRRTAPVQVVENGVDPVESVDLPSGLPPRFVVLVGSVGARKRQLPAVRMLATTGGPPPVVIGGFEDPPDERAAFAAAVEQAGGVWLGEVHDAPLVRSVVRAAVALVHLSTAEGQSLAVLEALSEDTPVALAPLPASWELAARFPAHVAVVEREHELGPALERLAAVTGEPPSIPSWDDVAARLERVYCDAGARSAAA